MARNVRILIGKQEQTFNNVRKIITDDSTGENELEWVEATDLSEKEITENGVYEADDDNVDGYKKVTVNVAGGAGSLIEKEITENGVYTALDDDNVYGYSRVRVNVAGGGGPEGEEIEAQAVENISAGDTVYVIRAGSGGEASQVANSIINYIAQGDHIAYDGREYIYFKSGMDIMRLSINNLNGTPEVYHTSTLYVFAKANIIVWTEDIDGTRKTFFETVNNGHVFEGAYNFSDSSRWNKYAYFNGMEGVSGWYRIRDLHFVQTNPVNYNAYARYIDDTHLIYSYSANAGTTHYDEGISGSTTQSHTLNVKIHPDNTLNTVGNYIITQKYDANANGRFDWVYIEIGSDTVHDLKDANGNTLDYDRRVFPIIDSTGDRVYICTTDGIAIVNAQLDVAVYTNIIPRLPSVGAAENNCSLFDDYFWDCANRLLYKIPSENTVGKCSNKSHAGSLGYVQQDIAQGETGKAIVLFN